MATTKTTPRTEGETQAISRLRALGQGVRVYCLERYRTYCVPSAACDGSAYSVMISGETVTCSCAAGTQDKYCKHIAAVTMYREAQGQLEQATSLAVDVRLHEQLEQSLETKISDLYR